MKARCMCNLDCFTAQYGKYTHTHTRLMALCPGLPRWAGTRKVKPIWILLKQETVCCSGISWAICKSAPRPRQIIMPAPHHSVFYRLDALPATQATASKHWRHSMVMSKIIISVRNLSSLNCRFFLVCWNFSFHQQWHTGSETLYQHNPPGLNWRCRLT